MSYVNKNAFYDKKDTIYDYEVVKKENHNIIERKNLNYSEEEI